jgi:hypothetical protein
MGVIVEALVQMVVGAWTEGLRGQARRVTIAILVLAPNHHTKPLSVPEGDGELPEGYSPLPSHCRHAIELGSTAFRRSRHTIGRPAERTDRS